MLRLVAGNLNYSSWSMRAWLALKLSGVDFKTHDVGMFEKEGWKDHILGFSGAGKVPVLVDGQLSVHESLAICETIAERFPEAELWPRDPQLRARGRAISCEMVSGFSTIRQQMPCNLRGRTEKVFEGDSIGRELARVFDLFEASLSTSPGDFLLGNFGIADCMYMPVLSRFRTYGVAVPDFVRGYSERVFSHPVVAELDETALSTVSISHYDACLR